MQSHANPVMPDTVPMGGGPGFVSRHRAFVLRLAISGAFLIAAATYAAMGGGEFALLLALAAGFGGYMAINIGANDVTNNIGPMVGARVMPLGAALVMAAICEAAGAIIAGGEVVGTIRSGIIDPALISSTQTYVWAMLAALLAAAVWLNLAPMVGAPVSTTHSIVGGVLGAGVAAAGLGIVDWSVMRNIAASWILLPLFGAAMAAICLYIVKRGITYQPDLIASARRGVSLLAASMAWAFTTYLLMKGLSKIVSVSLPQAMLGGLVIAAVVWAMMRGYVARRVAVLADIRANHPDGDTAAAEGFIARFHATPFGQRTEMLADLKARNRAGTPSLLDKADRKTLVRAHKRDIVNRALMLRIFAAWVITVPATAILSALVFFTLRGILLP